MFVDILSNEEKFGLLQLITAIAQADGEISHEEEVFINSYANEHGISFNINSEIDISSACSSINTPKAKIIALQEIIKMALIDGHYANEERNGALAISNMLSLSSEKFNEIEEWVIQGQSWVKKGEEMLSSA